MKGRCLGRQFTDYGAYAVKPPSMVRLGPVTRARFDLSLGMRGSPSCAVERVGESSRKGAKAQRKTRRAAWKPFGLGEARNLRRQAPC